MQFFAVLAAGLAATFVNAQDGGTTPPGCMMTYTQPFYISTLNATGFKQPALVRRQDSPGGSITYTLSNGALTDSRGDIGYIASNQQFQFDNPVQAGSLQQTPFAVCPNMTLALGGTTIFYSCLSGNFSNLYDQSIGAQCSQVFISINPASGSSSAPVSSSVAPTTPAVTQTSDGQPQAATSAPTAVTQISDNQPQAATSAPVPITQISDNQPQAATSAPTPTPVFNNGAASNGLSMLALAGAGALAVFVL